MLHDAEFRLGGVRHRVWNRTGYDTRDLVSWTRAAFQVCRIRKAKRIIFTSSPIRSRGCAETTPDRCGSVLSVAVASPSRFTKAKFARLLEHECMHLQGLEHEDMGRKNDNGHLLYSDGPLPAWARRLSLTYRRRAMPQIRLLRG